MISKDNIDAEFMILNNEESTELEGLKEEMKEMQKDSRHSRD